MTPRRAVVIALAFVTIPVVAIVVTAWAVATRSVDLATSVLPAIRGLEQMGMRDIVILGKPVSCELRKQIGWAYEADFRGDHVTGRICISPNKDGRRYDAEVYVTEDNEDGA